MKEIKEFIQELCDCAKPSANGSVVALEDATRIVAEAFTAGSNYDTVKRKISELGLDTSHMTGKVWNQGERYRPVKEAKPLEEILVEHSSYISTYHLKERLLKEGVKECKCECCGNTKWMGEPIALELHHVNGVKDDLRIENLQILCPNCHAFTDNYRGRNIGK